MLSSPRRADPLRRYPGAKAGAGVYQRIINEFPPHAVYVEPFVGSGQIFLRKRPAALSVVSDADSDVVEHWRGVARSLSNVIVRHADGRSLIGELTEAAGAAASPMLIYCDPPYVRSSRRNAGPLYRCEMSLLAHARLLRLLRVVPCYVALSGYRNRLYDRWLADWRRVDFRTMTRGGPALESLWLNYAEPAELHDPAYLGVSFRERQDIKRKRARWRPRLASMPAQEQRALLAARPSSAVLPVGAPPAPLGIAADAAGVDPLGISAAAGSRIGRPADSPGAARAAAALPLVDVAEGPRRG